MKTEGSDTHTQTTLAEVEQLLKENAELDRKLNHWRSRAHAMHVALGFTHEQALVEQVGWYYRADLLGYTVSRKDGDWLIVLRVELKNGRRRVAFVSATSYFQLIRNVMIDITEKRLTLREDKYHRK